MTWQQRQAATPPASVSWKPEHPAAYPDPDADQYENGDTSSWAEDPTKGPYKQGPAPASVSWTPEHPAAKPDAAGAAPAPKQASLRAQAEAKAAKCIRVAQAVLPKTASIMAVENKALEMMNWKEAQLDTALTRLRLATLTASQEPTAEDLGLLVSDEFPADVGSMPGDQNGPEHYDYTGHMDDEAEMMLAEMLDEEDAPAEKKAHDFFDAYDMDDDGFITEDEWGGNPDVFTTLDGDDDGVLSIDDVGLGLGASFGRTASSKKHEARRAELARKVAMKRAAEEVEEEDEETDKSATKLASRIAHWIGQGDSPEAAAMLASMELGLHTAEEVDEDEAEEKKAEVLLAEMLEEEDAKEKKVEEKKAEEADDDEDADSSDKEAAVKEAADKVAELTAALRQAEKQIAAMQKQLAATDPMRVAEEDDDAEGEDEKLAALFEREAEAAEDAETPADEAEEKKAEDSDDDDISFDEVEKEDKEAKKASAQRPQQRKASQGVRQLGAVHVASTPEAELSKLWASAPDVSDVF